MDTNIQNDTEMPLQNYSDAADYTKFWHENLQKLEEISAGIEQELRVLEDEYKHFSSAFDKIAKDVAVMVSIQSSFNNIEGREQFLRLQAVMSKYRNRFLYHGIDFNLLHSLLKKTNKGLSESFELFPWLRHSDEDVVLQGQTEASLEESQEICIDPEKSPFKWVSFQSHGSWFLALFKDLEIVPFENASAYTIESGEQFTVKIDNKRYQGRYIFSNYSSEETTPLCFLIINNGQHVFAADRNGRRIYAQTDLVTNARTPFNAPINNSLIDGRVRLFGKNHLYINI